MSSYRSDESMGFDEEEWNSREQMLEDLGTHQQQPSWNLEEIIKGNKFARDELLLECEDINTKIVFGDYIDFLEDSVTAEEEGYQPFICIKRYHTFMSMLERIICSGEKGHVRHDYITLTDPSLLPNLEPLENWRYFYTCFCPEGGFVGLFFIEQNVKAFYFFHRDRDSFSELFQYFNKNDIVYVPVEEQDDYRQIISIVLRSIFTVQQDFIGKQIDCCIKRAFEIYVKDCVDRRQGFSNIHATSRHQPRLRHQKSEDGKRNFFSYVDTPNRN